MNNNDDDVDGEESETMDRGGGVGEKFVVRGKSSSVEKYDDLE